MDGNGRWAKAPRACRAPPAISAAPKRCAAPSPARASSASRYLTLFGFSSENWKRPLAEIDDLMGLLRLYLRSEIAELHRNGVRLRVIGDRAASRRDIVALIEDAEARTRDNDAPQSDGRAQLWRPRRDRRRRRAASPRRCAAGELSADEIDEAVFERHLFTAGMPDPDLLIRTSGEKRISNFLLWQSAYAELVFVDRLWPDFTKDDLEDAIREFRRRDRRYGASAGSR